MEAVVKKEKEEQKNRWGAYCEAKSEEKTRKKKLILVFFLKTNKTLLSVKISHWMIETGCIFRGHAHDAEGDKRQKPLSPFAWDRDGEESGVRETPKLTPPNLVGLWFVLHMILRASMNPLGRTGWGQSNSSNYKKQSTRPEFRSDLMPDSLHP